MSQQQIDPESQLPFVPEDAANKSDDPLMSSESHYLYPTQNAVMNWVWGQLADYGHGDMRKDVYDTDLNGVVDNADALNGHPDVYFQPALGFTPEDAANKDTDSTLSANSDAKYPSQKAIKAYVDAAIAGMIEQGTFTPTIAGSTTAGTATYTAQQGSYFKVGSLVFVQMSVAWTSGTGTGNLEVHGLPYNNTQISQLAIEYSTITKMGAGYQLSARVKGSTNQIAILQVDTAAVGNVPYDAAGTLRLSGCYLTT